MAGKSLAKMNSQKRACGGKFGSEALLLQTDTKKADDWKELP
jgi:hypothetical protein